MVIKLKKPLTVKGKELKELHLDFDTLTGNDLVQAEKEVRAMGEKSPFLAVSMQYQAAVAAKAIGCPVDDVLALSGKDFTHVMAAAADFLLN